MTWSTWNGDAYVLTSDTSHYIFKPISVYHPDIDDREYGHCRGMLRKNSFGGAYPSSTNSGSRSSDCNCFASALAAGGTTRGLVSTWNGSTLWLDSVPSSPSYSFTEKSVYLSSVDNRVYGTAVGIIRRSSVGGSWPYNTGCGTRCAATRNFSNRGGSQYGTDFSTRG